MKRILIVAALLLSAFAAAAHKIPRVVPALQSWEGRKGHLVLPAEGVIAVASDDAEVLRPMAEILADDLHALFGWNYRIVEGRPAVGAIGLSLGEPDAELGEEGYELIVGRSVAIEAPTVTGCFWGTRTLLQMLCNQPDGLMCGRTRDWPAYSVRGFMIDVGRKFFPMDYLRDYVRIMAFYKMNTLQVHLNDNGFLEFAGNDWNRAYSAFRMESDRFPGLTARDGSYSKEEFRDFQKEALRYGVTIIPEIDIPAHSLAFTHYDPRLAADNPEYGMDHLDLYKPEVYRFLDTLLDEYLSGDDPVFVGEGFCIGTDEYDRREAEQFRRFTNRYVEFVKGYGKRPWIWGSLKQMKGETPVPLDGVTVNAWNNGWMDLETAIAAGAEAVNMCDAFLYIVPAVNYYHDFLDARWLYDRWTPRTVTAERDIDPSPANLGAMFAVWNDRVGNGISVQDVHVRTFPAVQVLSEKTWRGDRPATQDFDAFEALCRRLPEAPGINRLGRLDGPRRLTPEGETVVLTGDRAVATEVREIGYPYAVEFEIRPDAAPASDAILFSSPHAEFVANWQGTGKFAFRRDGYEFVFHAFRLPADRWSRIRIEGDECGTSLYVDDRLCERLEGRVRVVYNERRQRKETFPIRETLVFPLERMGDERMGFKGELRNVVCRPLASAAEEK